MSAPEKSTPGDHNRLFARLTAVLAALVALNTLVYSCSERRQIREGAAVASAEAEVKRWEDAMRDLEELMKDRPDLADTSAQYGHAANWRKRCKLLSERTVKADGTPDSMSNETVSVDKRSEYPVALVEFDRAKAVFDRAIFLRGRFRDITGDATLLGRECAEDFAQAKKSAEDAVRMIPSTDNEPEKQVISTAFVDRKDSILLNRKAVNDKGFDIDIFWCDRSGQQDMALKNIVHAARFGRWLADQADAGSAVSGEQIGRIRLKRLAEPDQRLVQEDIEPTVPISFLFGASNQVEEQMADVMAKEARRIVTEIGNVRVQTLPGIDRWTVMGNDNSTPNYLSVYSCHFGETPPSPP